jgi:hypothetical protein
MSGRNFFAFILLACLLTVGFLGIAPVAKAESSGPSFLEPGKSARNNVIKIKRRGRDPRIHLPVGPGYVYYDYPYYYCRGYYPTHIGGYIYYPNYYRCSYDWGYNRSPGSTRRLRARRN